MASGFINKSAELTLKHEIKYTSEGKPFITHFSSVSIREIDTSYLPQELQDWVAKRNIQVLFKNGSKDTLIGQRLGTYISPQFIRISVNDTFIESVNNELKGIEYGNNTYYLDADLLSVKMYYQFFKVILHELQHALDDYRSGGQYTSSKGWEKHKFYHTTYDGVDNMPDKLKNNISLNYYRLPHEIEARFAEALHSIRLKTLDKTKSISKDDKWIKLPFDIVLSQLKHEFFKWNDMTDAVKKQLVKRVYKIWDEFDPNK